MRLLEFVKLCLRPVYVPVLHWVADRLPAGLLRRLASVPRFRWVAGRLVERGRRLVERGRRLLHRGRLGQAEAMLRRALALLPDPALVWRLLALIASERGDWAEAAAHWRKALASPLAPAEAAEAKGSLATALYGLGKDAEADALAEQLIASEHGRLLGLEVRAPHLLLRGRLKEAEAHAQSILAMQPDHAPADKLLACIAAERDDWPKAAAHWRRALAAPMPPPEAAEAMKGLVFALIHIGDFTQAEAVIAQLEARPQGALMAPELRMTLAQDALDDAGHAAARRAYRQRHPQAARQSPPWLRHAGGEDGPDAARYTPADLRDAADAHQAHLALAYLELRLPHSDYLQLARQAVERLSDPLLAEGAGASRGQVQAAAALQDEYLHQLLFYMCSGPELAEARRRASAFAQRFPESSRARLLLGRAAVAVNDYDAVKALVQDMGGGDLELWLAAADSDHERALAVWQRISRCRYHAAADRRGLHLRRRSAEPPAAFLKPGGERLLLFAAFRNERVFAPWFLDCYRRLGVDWFFIVDNLSTDGTAEYLAKQKDVTLFASRNNYAWAHAGMKWVNELMRRYGDGHWCVHVDSDEQLVPPPDGKGQEGALRRCVDAMAKRGEEALPAFMLDTYPQSLAAAQGFRPGDDPLASSPLIDPDYFFFGKEGCCFFRARGGVRDRLFGFHSTMEKAPVLRGGGGRFYLSAHHTSYARVSRTSGVLLHHKLLREALDLREGSEARERTEDRGAYCQVRHERYRSSPLFGKAGEIPRGPNAVAYESPAQLQRLGLIGDFASPAWFRGGGG